MSPPLTRQVTPLTPRSRLVSVSAAACYGASRPTAQPFVVRLSDLGTQATASSGSEEGLRAQAIAALAGFDAVNACERRFQFYRRDLEVRAPVPAGAACAAPELMVASAYTTVVSTLRNASANTARAVIG
jgi:hypothetical protein